MEKYSLTGINATQLAINLGIGYDQLVKYRPDDIKKFAEDKDFIENVINGADGASLNYLRSSITGLPILNKYMELSYLNENNNFDEAIILECVFIDVNKTKNIVKNQVVGASGTIKEFINSGDYVINIAGSIASESKWLYPTDQLSTFIKIMNVEDTILCINDFLNSLFGVDNIVIETFSLAQHPKFANVVTFSISALSDELQNNS